MSKLKVALVHDYLITFGGAERVLVALHKIWPEADVYVALFDKKGLGIHFKDFRGWKIKTSWFQFVPFAKRLISPFRFLLPFIWKSFNFSKYDLVISSSSWGSANWVKVEKPTVHLCYCHTPPRYLYGYPEAGRWSRYFLVKLYKAVVGHFLRCFDYRKSQEIDGFIANSKEVARRIRKFYRRSSIIIHPPVVVGNSQKILNLKKNFYLFAGRLFSYKHPELAIKACLKLKRRLVVVGDGLLRETVEKMVEKSDEIDCLGHVSDRKLWFLYQNCKAFLFPVEEEDFGLAPLEAAAFGKPTVAFFSGGAKETVLEGKTGVFFHELTADSLAEAIRRLEGLKIDSRECFLWAKNFSEESFQRKIKKEVLKYFK